MGGPYGTVCALFSSRPFQSGPFLVRESPEGRVSYSGSSTGGAPLFCFDTWGFCRGPTLRDTNHFIGFGLLGPKKT
ncbi:hypothetical protein E2542_SST13708 [Spatholobus suberectus]|nr:hypothetical protein E2542_SST13708 [Spatholobus suberectus]